MYNKKLARALSISLCAVVLAPSAIYAKEFKDVKKDGPYGWAYSYIDTLSDAKVIDGYPDGSYKPEAAVSFEEIHQLIKGIINPSKDEIKAAVDKYGKDIDSYGVASWAKEAIAISLDRNVITLNTLKQAKDKDFIGKTSDLVYPDRNTIAVFYARALNLSAAGDESLLRHEDKTDIPASTRGYLASLVKAGIFASTGSNGKFEGNRAIKRSEMAKITKLSYDYARTQGLNAKEETKKGKVLLATSINDIDSIIVEVDKTRMQFKVNSNTVYKMGDKTVKFSDIKIDQEVKITYLTSNEENIAGIAKTVEITNSAKDLIGYVTSTDKDSLKIDYVENDKKIDFSKDDKIKTDKNSSFELASDLKIYKLGEKVKLSSVEKEDLVEFKTDNSGKISEIKVFPRRGNVKGRIVTINASTSSKERENITLRLDDGKDYVFYGNYGDRDNPFNYRSAFKDLSVGDKVSLKTNYKTISGIDDNNEIETGTVTDVEFYSRSYYYNEKGRITLDTVDGRKRFYLMDNTEYIDKYGNRNPQIRESYLEDKHVELKLDGDKVIRLTEVDKKDLIDAKLQVMDIEIISNRNWPGAVRRYKLKTIASYNSNLSYGTTMTIDTNENYDRYDVLRVKGYISRDGNGENLKTEIVERPGKEVY
ncbi:MAG: S-layer homology domain-containing protein [Peptoniphilaceae bacterium]